MRTQFTLRKLLFAIMVIAFFLSLLRPVASINEEAATRIVPGMTEDDATAIVGASPGFYDGVGGYFSESDDPPTKGYHPSWVGLSGEIVATLDAEGRIAMVKFHGINVLGWSFASWFWERFNRVRFLDYSLLQRGILFLASTLLWVGGLALVMSRPQAPNRIARLGAFGLIVGPPAALAVFGDLFFADLGATAALLLSPVIGAVVGIALGAFLQLARPGVSPGPVACKLANEAH